LDSSHTTGIAQQNASTTPAVMRSVGHLLAAFENSIISRASETGYAKRLFFAATPLVCRCDCGESWVSVWQI
jgi:hypothetical protein